MEPTMHHIDLAKWADLFLVAPASANTLAKLAHGLADDLLTNTALASSAPLVLAPAMNQAMWKHPATQHNVGLLQMRGARFLGPDKGVQACGDCGPGRMLEPADIVKQISPTLDLKGTRILITAGPTIEAIDPVRFLSNRSSGKMGYALARVATERGAEVTLVSGPTALQKPSCHKIIEVQSAQDMLAAVQAEITGQHVLIAAAAVADFTLFPQTQKIKKQTRTNNSNSSLNLNLIPTTDIVAEIGKRPDKPFIICFAAETENQLENARSKLNKKKADLVVLNDVSRSDIGFDQNENEVTLVTETQIKKLDKTSKTRIASQILDQILF